MKKRRSFPWFKIASSIAVLCLPLIYGFLYLWAFWDPYGALKHLPVAVVNLDQGGERNINPYNLGDKLVDKLKNNTALEWHFVDQSTAEDGLKTRKFYAIITIPSNFSHNVLSAEDVSAQPAQIELVSREASNFMAAKFAESATVRLVAEINKEVSAEYWHNVFVSLRETGDELHQAVDGSQKISTGITTIIEGDEKLAVGLDTAKDGSKRLVDGMTRIQDGGEKLKNNLKTAEDGAGNLHNGLNDMTSGLASLTSSLGKLKSGADQVSGGISSSKNGVDQAIALLADPTKIETAKAILTQVSTGLSSTQTGAMTVSAGLGQAQAGSDRLLAGAGTAVAGSGRLKSGLGDLYGGSVMLVDAIGEARGGVAKLDTGIADLRTGNQKLGQGLVELDKGAATLHTELAKGEKEIRQKASLEKENTQVPVLSEPVRYTAKPIAKVANNGTGFAPYFIPLALWVGAMACFFMYPNPRFRFPEILIFGLFGTGQALLLMMLLILVLKMEVLHLPLYLLFGISLSWCYLLIQGVINHALKDGGKFVNILILMLQLTSSAGSYPLETSPTFFQSISPYLPMTYAVKFLREVISGGDMTFAQSNFKIIIIMGVIALSLHLTRETRLYLFARYETRKRKS